MSYYQRHEAPREAVPLGKYTQCAALAKCTQQLHVRTQVGRDRDECIKKTVGSALRLDGWRRCPPPFSGICTNNVIFPCIVCSPTFLTLTCRVGKTVLSTRHSSSCVIEAISTWFSAPAWKRVWERAMRSMRERMHHRDRYLNEDKRHSWPVTRHFIEQGQYYTSQNGGRTMRTGFINLVLGLKSARAQTAHSQAYFCESCVFYQ